MLEISAKKYQNRIDTLQKYISHTDTIEHTGGIEYTCDICGGVFIHDGSGSVVGADKKIRCKVHKYVLDSTLAKQGRTEVSVHWLHEKECQCHFCFYQKIDVY